MRAFPVFVMAGLLVLLTGCGSQSATNGSSAATSASVPKPASSAALAATSRPPMTRLPTWAVPESYDLSIKSDPDKPDYSGTVTIAVDLKKASDHLWLHGKDLKIGRAHV